MALINVFKSRTICPAVHSVNNITKCHIVLHFFLLIMGILCYYVVNTQCSDIMFRF